MAVTYPFLQWFVVTCRYTYNKLDSHNSLVPDYEDHIIMFEISAAKELMRW